MVGGTLDALLEVFTAVRPIMDGEIELVCGAQFVSRNQGNRKSSLLRTLVYANFEEMILKEKQLPEGERMDFVSIVTPNHMHAAPTKLALENGFDGM